jgi:hypothetical protein
VSRTAVEFFVTAVTEEIRPVTPIAHLPTLPHGLPWLLVADVCVLTAYHEIAPWYFRYRPNLHEKERP